jgi:hypothetical protein
MESSGEPEQDGSSAANKPFFPMIHHREAAYNLVSVISLKTPFLFSTDLQVAKMLFSALSSETPTVKLTVQQVLSSVATAYSASSDAVKNIISEMLLENIHHTDPKVRRCSVEWAMSIFPFHYVPARFICMCLCGDPLPEVREVATKGLSIPDTGKKGAVKVNPYDIPDFIELLYYINDHIGTGDTTPGGVKRDALGEAKVGGRLTISLLPDLAMKGIIAFVTSCLHLKSKYGSPVLEFHDLIRKLLDSDRGKSALSYFCNLMDHSLDRTLLGGDALLVSTLYDRVKGCYNCNLG